MGFLMYFQETEAKVYDELDNGNDRRMWWIVYYTGQFIKTDSRSLQHRWYDGEGRRKNESKQR